MTENKLVKPRDYYFDNAKFILIFLVVFGHLLQPFVAEHDSVRILYSMIYTFHMPAFILISGYFAKGFRKSGYLMKTMKKLILPYLLFQSIYSVFYYFLLSEDRFSLTFLDPEWSLWFLLSLFFWNLMLYVFSKLKPVTALSIATLIGLLAGYVDSIDGYLSLSRTFVFFPFFLAGFFLKKEHFLYLQKNAAKIIGGAIFIAILGIVLVSPGLDEDWFLGSKPYGEFVDAKVLGLLMRVLIYAISFAAIAAFFTFVPKRQFFFTKWGKNTLYVYLLHGFFIKSFREAGMSNISYNFETFFILIVLAFSLTALLSTNIVTTIVQPVVELRINKIKNFLQRNKSFSHESY
ncbi:acyltransferase family protein [Listeria aquatica]|uniref:acyltransferase family protein n=1 Tax=Listeria aquatica TaxID=1494960 RepID=UPI0031F53C6C